MEGNNILLSDTDKNFSNLGKICKPDIKAKSENHKHQTMCKVKRGIFLQLFVGLVSCLCSSPSLDLI
ncbi:unnamed protein product [Moneuplotes crassus]|uniref:Uncharacterized protein n=1 Tax=Euplotes crassus TaxID=5936 RepID=A0AAD2D5L7_EUPCR|nr:unnamed protein product [Moneuplotes crassus]